MSPEEAQALQALRAKGYAVIVFNAEELEGAEPALVETCLIERGWDVIWDLRPREQA